MRDWLGPGTMLGYCTNVHAGVSHAQTLANLEEHALAVKARVSRDAPMGIGLWLAHAVSRELQDPARASAFSGWLEERGLVPFTMNGFPYGNFHSPVVKHAVYQPDWASRERARYTVRLAEIHARLLRDESEGSISTLPVGWRPRIDSLPGALEAAASNLVQVAARLAQIEAETGKFLHVDLEPEPGCWIDTAEDLIRFFEDYLLRVGDERLVRRHLGACLDVCHVAVMFEDPADVVRRFRAAGVRIGKVQVSAALAAPLGPLTPAARVDTLSRLGAFHEERYLHQTVIRTRGENIFFDDLGEALASRHGTEPSAGEWRVHFHVPLHFQGDGALRSTAGQIAELLAALEPGEVRHFEVETYAWDVLPPELRPEVLADGIAREIRWLCETAGHARPA